MRTGSSNARSLDRPGVDWPPPMLTVFTLPEPMAGAAAVAQPNAVRSCHALGENIEIVVFGDEQGVVEAEEVAARHVPAIRRRRPEVDELRSV
jgi:hypothetical protein